MRVTAASISTLLLGLASAKTWTVRPTSGKTIQKTIDDAHPGDRIVVEPGVYAEQLTISKNGITLIGHQAKLTRPGTASNNTCSGLAGFTFLDSTVPTEAGICITGTGVHLENFQNGEHRKFQSVDCTVKEVTVSGFTVSEDFSMGIVAIGARDATISSNTVIDQSNYGVLAVGSINTVIKRNTIHSTPLPYPFIRFIGICMDDKKSVTVHSNEISEYVIGLCVQTNGANVYKNKVLNTCAGAFVDPGVNGAKVHDNEIIGKGANCGFDNPFWGIIGVWGIEVFGATNTIVKNNKIERPGFGIVLFDEPSHVASGNVLEKNTISGPANVTAEEFDILIASGGKGNVAKNNVCAISSPDGACK